MKSWYKTWFNEDYLNLYAHRSLEEAEEQVAFIVKHLELQGDERVLDLGCGYGRHSLSFGKRGFPVLGVDLSPVLISKARILLKEMSSDEDLPVEFLIADMRDFSRFIEQKERRVGTFDLVVNLFTSFGYFEEDAENTKIFHEIYRQLKKEGKFFFDYLHPAKVRREHFPFERQQIENEMVEIHKVLEENFAIKKVIFPGREYQEKVKLYTRFQIEEMLREAGFSIEAVWDDYAGTPWREDGDRQIFYCKVN